MTQAVPSPAANPLAELPGPLLAWYDRNARILPWREDPTPYRVWVSEIMLQQTRVEAGKPYFERFVEYLPHVQALADADEALLLKLWEGLGYYSRVRNLQKAARIVVSQYGGILPSDPALLRKLPGLGAYTAGAIASIAFGIPAPAVDGNVLRVVARLLNDSRDVLSPAVKKDFESMVAEVIPVRRAGDFNQALMELGATVCLPNGAPLCGECPVAHLCGGRAAGSAGDLPAKSPRAVRKSKSLTVLLFVCGPLAAIRQRPPKGLLASLWEFPTVDGCLDAQEVLNAAHEVGMSPVAPPRELGPAEHIFTHVKWQLQGWTLEVKASEPTSGLVWATLDEINGVYAIPSAYKAYTARLPGLLESGVPKPT